MNIIRKITRGMKYVVCGMILDLAMFITFPLKMIFKLDKFWILSIANSENCSIKKAKVLMKKLPKYRFDRWSLKFPNEPFDLELDFNRNDSALDISYTTNPSYSYRPDNVFYSSRYDS